MAGSPGREPQPGNRGLLALFLAPLLTGGLALVLYGCTMPPGLTWAHDGADGGDLLSAALTRGVPHPPGYPLHQLLLRAAIATVGSTRLGGSSPARAGNWLSAICAALAAALLADLIRRSLCRSAGGQAGAAAPAIALVAAFAWAVPPALWSQAVITEVYTLNALAVVVTTWLLWRWREACERERPGAGSWLGLAGLALGLGLANHLSVALMLPGIGALLWSSRSVLARARGAAPRSGLAAACGLAAGLALYLYLPWAAAGDPPVNWGNPRTPASLAWVVTAQPYRSLAFGLAPGQLPGRAAAWAGQALGQFWPWGAALALLGLWRLDRGPSSDGPSAGGDPALWRFTGLTALAFSVYAVAYNTRDSYVYLIPAWAMAAVWMAHGMAEIGDWRLEIRAWRFRNIQSPVSNLLIILFALAIPVASLAARYPAMDLSRERRAEEFIEGALQSAGPGSVVLVAGDERTFALWYAIYGLRHRADVTPLNVNLYGYPWYRATLASHHPLLAEGPGRELPALPGLLDRLAAEGRLYRAEPLPEGNSRFEERPEGTLVRLLPKDEG